MSAREGLAAILATVVSYMAFWRLAPIATFVIGCVALACLIAILRREGGKANSTHAWTPNPSFANAHPIGTRMRKRSGSSWQGKVVGYYSTALTPRGYAVESEREPGSVQIYPDKALELVGDGE